jgi:nitrite reductase/ring-hydroxylating ferredoxin subunit
MNPVSYVPVNYTLNITQEYPHFVVDNGYNVMTITKTRFDRECIGYAGLVVWIGMDGQYHAADLCCPHCLLKHKPVEVDGFYAICPKCEEHYDLSYGYANPTKGMTKFGLKMYQTILSNSMTGYSLRIVN